MLGDEDVEMNSDHEGNCIPDLHEYDPTYWESVLGREIYYRTSCAGGPGFPLALRSVWGKARATLGASPPQTRS